MAVATQDRLAYGPTFEEALRALFPEIGPSAKPSTPSAPAAQPAPPPPQASKPAAPATPAGNDTRLIQQAAQLLADYERLTAEGKHREAGEKLDQLKQTLAELKRLRGGQ